MKFLQIFALIAILVSCASKRETPVVPDKEVKNNIDRIR